MMMMTGIWGHDGDDDSDVAADIDDDDAEWLQAAEALFR
jgi:hypothetical protein